MPRRNRNTGEPFSPGPLRKLEAELHVAFGAPLVCERHPNGTDYPCGRCAEIRRQRITRSTPQKGTSNAHRQP